VICGIGVASLGGVALGVVLGCVCEAGGVTGETGGGAFGSCAIAAFDAAIIVIADTPTHRRVRKDGFIFKAPEFAA
jgi:hypothetical protein